MAEIGDIMNEWRNLNTPGKVVLVGAVVGLGIVVWAIHRGMSGGTINTTGTPSATDQNAALLQSILTQLQSGGGSGTTTTTTPAKPAPPSPFHYVVKPGDTMDSIAKQFNVTPGQLSHEFGNYSAINKYFTDRGMKFSWVPHTGEVLNIPSQ